MGKRQLVFGFGRTCDRRPFYNHSITRSLDIDRLWIVCDYLTYRPLTLQTFLIFFFLCYATKLSLTAMYTMPIFVYLG